MNERKLRRVAIVALVLVLLCSTLGVQASTTEPQRSPNWVEYITMILLAVLVGLEIKDKLHKEK